MLAVVLVYWTAGSSRTTGGNSCLAEAARMPTPTPDPSTRLPAFVIHDSEAECRLRRGLLTNADFGVVGGRNLFNDHVSGPTVVDCRTSTPEPIAGLTGGVDQVSGRGFDTLVEYVFAFRTGGGSDFMAALRRSCAMLASGTEDERRLSQLADVPRLGDDSIAIRNSFGFTHIATVYIRQGDLLTMVSVRTDRDKDAALAEVGKLAAEKLWRVGLMPEPTYAAGEGCVASPTPRAETADVLSDGMLTLNDMPVGWVHDPPGPCGRIDGEGACKSPGKSPPEPLSSVTTGFRGSPDQYLSNKLEVYGGDDASALIAAVRRALPSECVASFDGKSYDLRWDPVDVPALGDDAVAMHFNTHGLQTEVSYYVILIRRGRTVTTVAFEPGHFGRGSDTAMDTFKSLSEHADSRLASIQRNVPAD